MLCSFRCPSTDLTGDVVNYLLLEKVCFALQAAVGNSTPYCRTLLAEKCPRRHPLRRTQRKQTASIPVIRANEFRGRRVLIALVSGCFDITQQLCYKLCATFLFSHWDLILSIYFSRTQLLVNLSPLSHFVLSY